MAEGEGLGSLLLYVVFVYPVCSWILAPGRFKRDRSIIYAIMFLAAIALGKLSLEWKERGRNYYQMMGVSRGATALEIKRAYKKISLELHPDKNPSEDAATQFARMKDAYDVLMDMELRDVYNKLGPDAIKANRRLDENTLLIEMLVFYVSWGILSYLLTLGKSSASARNWIFTGEIVMLVAEVSLLLTQDKMPDWLLPMLTEHEIIWVLHSIFPAFMNGCRSLGSFLYVDIDKQTRSMLLALHESHKDILMVLRDIQVNMQTLSQGGGRGPAAIGSKSNIIPVRATPTGKIRELEERMSMNGGKPGDIAAQIKDTEKTSGNHFWWFLAAYFIFYYVMG